MTEQNEHEAEVKMTAYEKFQVNIKKAKASAEKITNKALEDRSLIEEMDLELEELASDLEGQESKLFGTQDEIESEAVEQILDENPHSSTFQQMIDAPTA